jgi:hypothetical protein
VPGGGALVGDPRRGGRHAAAGGSRSAREPSLILKDVKPVGYHAWLDAQTLVLFVLGSPATLQLASATTGTSEVVASNIGRSLHRIPGTTRASFVDKSGAWTIRSLDPMTKTIEAIVATLDGSEDYAWTLSDALIRPGPEALLLPAGKDTTWRFRRSRAGVRQIATRGLAKAIGVWARWPWPTSEVRGSSERFTACQRSEGHKARLHGHSFRFAVRGGRHRTQSGWVLDFAEIKEAFRPFYEAQLPERHPPLRTPRAGAGALDLGPAEARHPGLCRVILHETCTAGPSRRRPGGLGWNRPGASPVSDAEASMSKTLAVPYFPALLGCAGRRPATFFHDPGSLVGVSVSRGQLAALSGRARLGALLLRARPVALRGARRQPIGRRVGSLSVSTD